MNIAMSITTRTVEAPLMSALRRHLPITLLADLVDPDGPRSHDIYRRELKKPDAVVLTIPELSRVGSAR